MSDNKKDTLENLPVYLIEKSAFKTRVIDPRGKVVDEWFFTRDLKMGLSSWFIGIKMNIKCNVANYLLKGVADACPYCKKLIRRDTFKKLIPDGDEARELSGVKDD